MEGFTIIDGVVAGVIVLSAILAYSRGLIREAMAILGWIGAALLAYLFAAEAQPLVKELPVVGPMLADSCELSVIAAFAAVFAVGLVVAAIFTPLLSGWVNQTMLGGLDQGLGFLFGVIRGVVLVAIAFIVYDRAVADNSIPMVDNSRSAKVFASFQGNIDDQIPSDAPGWIVSKYEGLVGICAAPTQPASPEAPAANN
ncbi:CvpA family protein [Gemmobacter lutimaris]|uniref:CvpA family protein n=1 Tax=Gemmobacter lutimaris TaxID=2306023 RepID=A0A398BJQ7_9RHOB|nr:CvpA family protein [Gemmobacter lutimaris]RID90642.1 CvpA family protein [Gemmobacter lutimaris]